MLEKITALVFGILALVLEVFLSVKNPTVESIVAAAFAAVIVIAVVVLIIKDKKNIITLTEGLPNGKRPVDKALKLANEIAPYVKEKNGKVTLKIVK